MHLGVSVSPFNFIKLSLKQYTHVASSCQEIVSSPVSGKQSL